MKQLTLRLRAGPRKAPNPLSPVVATAQIVQGWLDRNDFNLWGNRDDYFEEGQPMTVNFYPRLKDGSNYVPYRGHTIEFAVTRADVTEYNATTDDFELRIYTTDANWSSDYSDLPSGVTPTVITDTQMATYATFNPVTAADTGGATAALHTSQLRVNSIAPNGDKYVDSIYYDATDDTVWTPP